MAKRRGKRAKRPAESYVSRDPTKRQAQLGNLRAVPPLSPGRPVAHGAYARVGVERLDTKAREVFGVLALDAPLRERDGGLPAADSVAVRLLADTLCRLDSIGEYLQRRGWQDEDGSPRSVLEIEARLRGNALDLLRELGMTPRARAALGLDVVRGAGAAFDLARHWQDEGGDDAGA